MHLCLLSYVLSAAAMVVTCWWSSCSSVMWISIAATCWGMCRDGMLRVIKHDVMLDMLVCYLTSKFYDIIDGIICTSVSVRSTCMKCSNINLLELYLFNSLLTWGAKLKLIAWITRLDPSAVIVIHCVEKLIDASDEGCEIIWRCLC